MKTAPTAMLAIAVPMAAPRVPYGGMSRMLSRMFNTVIRIPRRIGVLASPAARSAPLNMKNSSIPMLETNMTRIYGTASTWTSGAALISVEQRRRCEIPDWREHPQREHEAHQQRLVDATIHLVGIACAGKARDEDTHAGEDRSDEHDHQNENLQAGADGGVADVADVMADHRLVDDALQPADDVLHHRRPRQAPDRVTERSLDDRPVELSGRRPKSVSVGHDRCSGGHLASSIGAE